MTPTVGVIGGGQLARMMVPPAVELGIGIQVLAETVGSSASLAATVVGEKLSDAVDRAKPVLSKTATQASDAAAEIGWAVGRNLRELQAEAPQPASEAERTARRTARKARRQARRHAANLRDKADALPHR